MTHSTQKGRVSNPKKKLTAKKARYGATEEEINNWKTKNPREQRT